MLGDHTGALCFFSFLLLSLGGGVFELLPVPRTRKKGSDYGWLTACLTDCWYTS